MEWLNEICPTRVLLVFVGGLAVVVLWKALQGLIGYRDHCHEHKMRVAYLGEF
jgi:hypothetical protein